MRMWRMALAWALCGTVFAFAQDPQSQPDGWPTDTVRPGPSASWPVQQRPRDVPQELEEHAAPVSPSREGPKPGRRFAHSQPDDVRKALIGQRVEERCEQLKLDQAKRAKLQPKIQMMEGALKAWDERHADQLAGMDNAIEAATSAGQLDEAKRLELRLAELLDQRGQLSDEFQAEALATLDEDDRAGWYALELVDLGQAYATNMGGALTGPGQWKLLDVARAKGLELAKAGDKATLRNGLTSARDAVIDSASGAMVKSRGKSAGTSKAAADAASARSKATDQSRTGGSTGGMSAIDAATAQRERELEWEITRLNEQIIRKEYEVDQLKAAKEENLRMMKTFMDWIVELKKALADCLGGKVYAE